MIEGRGVLGSLPPSNKTSLAGIDSAQLPRRRSLAQ